MELWGHGGARRGPRALSWLLVLLVVSPASAQSSLKSRRDINAGNHPVGAIAVHGANGFWGLIATVQTPGAPALAIAFTTTNTVAVSWPSPSTGFTLQQNTNSVSSVNWSDVVTISVDDGTAKTVIVNPPTGNRYYRLFKP